MKKNRHRVQKFLIVLLILSFSAVLFCRPVKDAFFSKQRLSKTLGTTNPNLRGSRIIKIEFSTKRLFSPYEKIHVKVKYAITSDSLANIFINNSSPLIMFENSFLTNANINKRNKTPDGFNENEILSFIYDKKSDGIIQLYNAGRVDKVQKYIGEGEIYFQQEGEFKIRIANNPAISFEELPETVKISGSTIEVLNIKTNTLLFTIAVVGFLFTLIKFYFEMKKNLLNSGSN